jgi:hypothetical protein
MPDTTSVSKSPCNHRARLLNILWKIWIFQRVINDRFSGIDREAPDLILGVARVNKLGVQRALQEGHGNGKCYPSLKATSFHNKTPILKGRNVPVLARSLKIPLVL